MVDDEMLIGILLILFMAAGVLGAILVVSIAMIAASLRAAGDERYCGKCGYCARGLVEHRCPECGSDFNVVGLVDRPPGRNWRGAVYVVAWALLSPIVFYVAAAAMLERGPVLVQSHAFEVWHGPHSGAYEHVYVEHNSTTRTGASGSGGVRTRSTWQVKFETGDGMIDVLGDALNGVAVVSRGSSSTTKNAQPSEGAIAEIMTAAFSDANSEKIAHEAKEVHGLLSHMMNPASAKPALAAFERAGNTGWSEYRTPHRAFGLSVLGGAVALWAAGLVWLVWWARRPRAL